MKSEVRNGTRRLDENAFSASPRFMNAPSKQPQRSVAAAYRHEAIYRRLTKKDATRGARRFISARVWGRWRNV